MTRPDQPKTAARFWRSNHVAWRRIGSEMIVLDLKGKRAFGLNEPGGALWTALTGRSDAETTANAFAPPEPEAQAFLAELADLGLVDVAPEGTPTAATLSPLALVGRPKIVWSDEIRSFGATCGFIPGEPSCRNNPVQ